MIPVVVSETEYLRSLLNTPDGGSAIFSSAAQFGFKSCNPEIFHYPGEKDSAILIRTETGEFRAYSQQCTHLACPVYYERRQKRLECPCHEGAFDAATGSVLYGPPPRPLDSIDLEMRNGELWAVGKRTIG